MSFLLTQIQRVADRVAVYFVPSIVTLALAVYFLWSGLAAQGTVSQSRTLCCVCRDTCRLKSFREPPVAGLRLILPTRKAPNFLPCFVLVHC